MTRTMKDTVEPSYKEKTLAKKARNPQPMDSRPRFKSTSERYKRRFRNLNLTRTKDKTKTAKAVEKNTKIVEGVTNPSDFIPSKRASAVSEKPAKVNVILSLLR